MRLIKRNNFFLQKSLIIDISHSLKLSLKLLFGIKNILSLGSDTSRT